jgi:hypothetical protein
MYFCTGRKEKTGHVGNSPEVTFRTPADSLRDLRGQKVFHRRDARRMPKSAKNTHELPWIGTAPLLRAFTAMGVILSGSRFSGEVNDLAPRLESFPQELSRTSR